MNELKKILIFLFCFAGGVFVVDRLCGLLFENLFENVLTGQSGGKINYYLQLEPEPDLIVAGDSRALSQVIPDSFSNTAFNISHAGMDDVFQETLISLLFEKRKNPKTILLHIDPVYYTGKYTMEKSLYLKPFYAESQAVKENINNSGKYERLKFFFSCYRYNTILLNTIKNTGKDPVTNLNGYEPIAATAQDTIRTRLTAASDTIKKNPILNKEKLKHLIRIIELCKKNNVKLICFTGPVWKEKDLSAVKNIQLTLDSLLGSNAVPFLDYSRMHQYDEELQVKGNWNDCYHLNEKGAAIFSRIISRDAEQPISSPIPTR